MGCFKMSCGITRLPIRDGEECYAIPLLGAGKISGYYLTSHTYVDDVYRILAPVIVGKYSDYGSIDCIDGEFYKEYLSILDEHTKLFMGEDRVEYKAEDIEGHMRGYSGDKPTIELLLNAIERSGVGDKTVTIKSGKWRGNIRQVAAVMLVKKSFVDKLEKEWKPVRDIDRRISQDKLSDSVLAEMYGVEKYKKDVERTMLIYDFMIYSNFQIAPSNYAGQSVDYKPYHILGEYMNNYVDDAYKEYCEDVDKYGDEYDTIVDKSKFIEKSDDRMYFEDGKIKYY